MLITGAVTSSPAPLSAQNTHFPGVSGAKLASVKIAASNCDFCKIRIIANIHIRSPPEAEANDSGLRARTWTVYLCSICSCIGNVSFCALVLQIVSVDLESEPIPFYRFSSVGPLVDPFHQVTANLG